MDISGRSQATEMPRNNYNCCCSRFSYPLMPYTHWLSPNHNICSHPVLPRSEPLNLLRKVASLRRDLLKKADFAPEDKGEGTLFWLARDLAAQWLPKKSLIDLLC